MKLFGVENTSRDDHAPVTHELIREKNTGFPFIGAFIVILLFLTLVWLFVSWRVSEWCTYYGHYTCWQGAFVFWSLPFVLFVFLIGAAIMTLLGFYYTARRSRLANALTEHYDEKDVSKYTPQLLGVANTLADSLRTAELDTLSTTYSPSHTTETSTTQVNSNDEKEDISDRKHDETLVDYYLRHGIVARSGNSLFAGMEIDDE